MYGSDVAKRLGQDNPSPGSAQTQQNLRKKWPSRLRPSENFQFADPWFNRVVSDQLISKSRLNFIRSYWKKSIQSDTIISINSDPGFSTYAMYAKWQTYSNQ